jgi:hypothetical protein
MSAHMGDRHVYDCPVVDHEWFFGRGAGQRLVIDDFLTALEKPLDYRAPVASGSMSLSFALAASISALSILI